MEKIIVGACVADLTAQREERLRQGVEKQGYTLKVFEKGKFGPEDVADCQVFFGNIPPAMIKSLPNLRWLATASAGVDNYVADELYPNPDVILTNSSGAYGVAIAEHLITCTLMLMRRMREYEEGQRQHRWKYLGKIRSLYGSTVTVVAYDDTWAQISNGSQLGFTQRSNLTPGIVAVATPTPTPAAGSFEELVESGKYSNEELTFLYLTREAGLNAAAACGVMANIKAESSFRPTAYNSNGGSYGICQWTGGRKTRLQNYCEDNGLDYTTIYGQLCFLEYELRNYYSKVWKYISAVDNTADGAYDAGYYFCYHFEVPANRASRSVTRGNSARDTYWPKYA